MKLLLDTHVLLWAIGRPELLSQKARQAMLDETNELVASVASIWEITIKVQAGKLELPVDADYLETNLRKLGVTKYLPVDLYHVYRLARLPLLHKDPFDRILLTQAMVEGLTLVSKDQIFGEYPVTVLW